MLEATRRGPPLQDDLGLLAAPGLGQDPLPDAAPDLLRHALEGRLWGPREHLDGVPAILVTL
eukprot:2081468-Pyramimonas_sp.AAC.1